MCFCPKYLNDDLVTYIMIMHVFDKLLTLILKKLWFEFEGDCEGYYLKLWVVGCEV